MTSTLLLSPRREFDPERTLEEVQQLLPAGAEILELSDTLVQYTMPKTTRKAKIQSWLPEGAVIVKILNDCVKYLESKTSTKYLTYYFTGGEFEELEDLEKTDELKSTVSGSIGSCKMAKTVPVDQYVGDICELNQQIRNTMVSGQAQVPKYTSKKKAIRNVITKLLLEEFSLNLYRFEKDSAQYAQHASAGSQLCDKLEKLLQRNCDSTCCYLECTTGATQGDFCMSHTYRMRNLCGKFATNLSFLVNKTSLNISTVIDACMPTDRRLKTPDGRIDGINSREKILYFVGKRHQWVSIAERALVIRKRYPEYTTQLVLYNSFDNNKRKLIVQHLPKTLQVAFLN